MASSTRRRCGRAALAAFLGVCIAACGTPDAPGDNADGDAGPVRVAAAANLTRAVDSLAAVFTATHGFSVSVSTGSSGQLYAQIRNGAPHEVFLSADQDRPGRLVADGFAVPASRFTYARGRMVLYAPHLAPLPDPAWGVLRHRRVRVAIANPRTAPYGVAARAALAAFGVEGEGGREAPILVTGENVGQALQFARSGAADVAFVALAQVLGEPPGHYALVPPDDYEPLWHDAVLLEPGRDRAGARAFLAFLREPAARDILVVMGYEKGDSTTRRP